MLNRIEYQSRQNRQKTEEYEKTVRLLKLVNKDKNSSVSEIEQ
jgi:hypothetical protein